MKTTVIMHFFNEEFLLPWWLEHHTRIFDHGILIDYESTDRSVEICRRLAPNWEVRPSRNQQFDARLADEEVMQIEGAFEGWKITLNVTEFFVCRDMELFTWALSSFGSSMYAIRSVIMVDPPELKLPCVDPSRPLVAQRHFGFFEDEKTEVSKEQLRRSRLFHRHPNGAYLPGRHLSNLPAFMHPPGALILWFGFSPWVDQVRARMLQIQTRIPESDKRDGYGIQHLVDAEGLERRYRNEAAKAEDLSKRPEYERLLSGWNYTITGRDRISSHRPLIEQMTKQRSSNGWDASKAAEEKAAAAKSYRELFKDYEFFAKKSISLEKDLDDIYSSRAWRLITVFRRFKIRLEKIFSR